MLERQALHFLHELVRILSLKVWIEVLTRQTHLLAQRGLLELQVDLQVPRLVRMLEPPVMVLVQVLLQGLQGDSLAHLSRLLSHLTSCLLLNLRQRLQEEQRDLLLQVQVPVLVPMYFMPTPIMPSAD